MKKRTVGLFAVMLAGLMATSLVGCGESSSYKVNGDFGKEEATKTEISTALSTVEADKLFGNMEAENWALGLKITSKFDVKIGLSGTVNATDITGAVNARNQEVKLTASENETYEFYVAKGTSEKIPYSMAGKGSMEVKVDGKMVDGSKTETMKGSAKATLYNNLEYAYVELTAKDDIAEAIQMESLKAKVNLEDLFELIGDMLPSVPEIPEIPEMPEAGDVSTDDLASAIDQLAAMGIKVYIDDSKGLKVKISMGEELVKQALGSISEDFPVEGMTFTSCVMDAYLSINDKGEFEKMSFDVDVSVKFDVKDSFETIKGTASIKGGLAIETSKSKVTLPDGIEKDLSYLPLPLGGIGLPSSPRPSMA